MRYELRDEPRQGDHICYITDLRKFVSHYREWSISRSIDDIFEEMVRSWRDRLKA
jgi:CDP-paratose 2-epimerase